MQSNIEKKVYYLQAYCILLTLIAGAFLVMGFVSKGKQKFEEIDAERINILAKDGTLNMVISNKERQHPGSMDGVTVEPRERAQGIIFFNDKGDEVGGLAFSGDGKTNQVVHLSFDKLKNDQTLTLDHKEWKNGEYFVGMQIADRPNISLLDTIAKMKEVEKITDPAKRDAAKKAMRESGELGTGRMFIGRSGSKAAVVSLADGKGKERLVMKVAENGEASLEFLDENGKVTSRFPQSPPEAGKAKQKK